MVHTQNSLITLLLRNRTVCYLSEGLQSQKAFKNVRR